MRTTPTISSAYRLRVASLVVEHRQEDELRSLGDFRTHFNVLTRLHLCLQRAAMAVDDEDDLQLAGDRDDSVKTLAVGLRVRQDMSRRANCAKDVHARAGDG